MFKRDHGWIDAKDQHEIRNIIIFNLEKEQIKSGKVIMNPFLSVDVNDTKILCKLHENLNMENIYNYVKDGTQNLYLESTLPYFTKIQVDAINRLINISHVCILQIISNDIKKEYMKILLFQTYFCKEQDMYKMIIDMFIKSHLYL